MSTSGQPQPAPGGDTVAPPDVKAWRLVATLGVAGALAGLLLVFVDQATRPLIEEHRRRALARAVQEVLSIDLDGENGARVVSLRVEPSALVLEEEARYDVDAGAIDRVFAGYGEDGELVGFAIVHERLGFQDNIRLIFGFDAKHRTVLGMQVLESRETPGLGDQIEKDADFVSQFKGRSTPLVPVKQGLRKAPAEVDTLTGATISTKAVIDIINAARARGGLADRLVAWLEEEGRSR